MSVLKEWLAWTLGIVGGCVLLGVVIATLLIAVLAIDPGGAVRIGAEVSGVFLAAFALFGLMVLAVRAAMRRVKSGVRRG